MILGTIIQQPNDFLDYDIACASLFNGEEDFLSAVEVSSTPSGLTTTGQVASATSAKIWVSGGTDGVTYMVTVKVTSDAGRVKEEELEVIIEEVE